MRRRFIQAVALLLLVSAVAVHAQALSHSVTLNWTDPNNPAGTTYNVYRATGLCSGTPTFSKLATGVTAKTYIDNTVQPGSYCFQVTATFSNLEGNPSNTYGPAVTPFSVTLSGSVQ